MPPKLLSQPVVTQPLIIREVTDDTALGKDCGFVRIHGFWRESEAIGDLGRVRPPTPIRQLFTLRPRKQTAAPARIRR